MPNLMKTVFDWDHFATYLSGPIDFDRMGGKNWRDEWTKGLIDIGFDPHQIFNPCRKPLDGAQFNLDDEAALMKKYRERREWSKLVNTMSQIVHVDLRLLDKSDLILVNMPMLHTDEKDSIRVPTYGTIHEMVVAHQQRKPIYMVWEGGKETCSGWLMWLVGPNNIFATFEALLTRLQNISAGNAAFNADDWLLLSFDKVAQ